MEISHCSSPPLNIFTAANADGRGCQLRPHTTPTIAWQRDRASSLRPPAWSRKVKNTTSRCRLQSTFPESSISSTPDCAPPSPQYSPPSPSFSTQWIPVPPSLTDSSSSSTSSLLSPAHLPHSSQPPQPSTRAVTTPTQHHTSHLPTPPESPEKSRLPTPVQLKSAPAAPAATGPPTPNRRSHIRTHSQSRQLALKAAEALVRRLPHRPQRAFTPPSTPLVYLSNTTQAQEEGHGRSGGLLS